PHQTPSTGTGLDRPAGSPVALTTTVRPFGPSVIGPVRRVVLARSPLVVLTPLLPRPLACPSGDRRVKPEEQAASRGMHEGPGRWRPDGGHQAQEARVTNERADQAGHHTHRVPVLVVGGSLVGLSTSLFLGR